MAITDKITGNQKVAEFVDVYNNNNKKLENEIELLKAKIELLENNYDKKADKSSLNDLIYREVIRVLDVEYNSEDNPYRFARISDVRDIVLDLMNEQR